MFNLQTVNDMEGFNSTKGGFNGTILPKGSGGGAVDSVNGMTGDVVLGASDVGALPDTTTVPSALSQLTEDSTHRTVTDSEKSTWNAKGTYSKPSYGIPKTDLAIGVQSSLYRADSALQEHQSLAAYRTAAAQDVIDGGKADKTSIASSIPAGGMLPNVLYRLGTISTATTMTMADPAESGFLAHYFFTFDTPATAPTITWDAKITSWIGGSAPAINALKHYEVSVVNGVGVAMEV